MVFFCQIEFSLKDVEENVSEPDIHPLNKQKKGDLSSDQVDPMLSYLLWDRENHHGEQVPWLERMKMAVQRFASPKRALHENGHARNHKAKNSIFCRQTDKKIMRAGVNNDATTTMTRQQQWRPWWQRRQRW